MNLRELRVIGEAALAIVVTHVLLGWVFGTAITQADGSVLVTPLVDSSLAAGPYWDDHLYRFSLLGGAKLHEFSGTPPLWSIAAALDLSTTTTLNLQTWFVQLGFAVFSILAIEALVEQPMSSPRRLLCVWLTAFAPVVGWRVGIGHENLLLGVLPFLATTSLLLVARVRMPTITSLVFAAFVIANGVSGLGAQSVLYSVTFGLPIVLAIARPSRQALVVAGVAVASVLVMLPRIAPMLAHATSEDASRALGDSVESSFGGVGAQDWLASILWTPAYARSPGHESNYPLGPLVIFAVAWYRSRAISRATLVALVLAVVYGSTKFWLPLLDAFREPARALLVVLPFVPIVALAAVFTRIPEDTDRRRAWGSIVLAIALIVTARHVPAPIRELVAWVACGLVVVYASRPRVVPFLLAAIAALGVTAFWERLPRGAVRGTIEDALVVRNALRAQSPDLSDPLDRVQIVDPPPPFEMSLGWAARLSTLDGVWYPPKRFLDLLGALRRRPAPPTMCVFSLTKSPAFPVLQQLYNVKYVVGMKGGEIQPLPETPGRAWFPHRLETAASPEAIADAMWTGRADLRATIATTGWLLARDAPPPLDPALPGCGDARVLEAQVDERGQRATFRLQTPSTCVLVVAANYVSTFHASHGGRVFPIDVALTGVVVPAGTSYFELSPDIAVAGWARALQVIGALGLIAALALAARAWGRRGTPRSEAAPP